MIRRAFRTVGAPVRALEIGFIRVYRATLSGWLGGQCRFYPTCSHYAEEAIRERGAVMGTALGVWRILRCNPFGDGGIDHVRGGSRYDDVTHAADRVEA
ncbi:MAG: membrane protein insertion efficiency factor YidD [Actinomycetota bacterium]